jgi:hypothetical protein
MLIYLFEGPLKKFGFFMPIRNPRWLPPQVIVLTQDHMGKYRNIFFSEAIALIEPKLCINHWKVHINQPSKLMAILNAGQVRSSNVTRGSQEPVSFTWL